MAKRIDVTEVSLLHAQQSPAVRMAPEDMVPVCTDLDRAGFWSVECWGGSTSETCIRLLNEDAWERLRTFRKLMLNTRLQMLLCGGDAAIDRVIEKAAENGIDVFRVFDALNDMRNLRQSIAAIRHVGKHAQGAICYSPSALQAATQFVELGCDSVCIRDTAALLKPQPAYELVKGIKAACGDVRVHVHVHAATALTMVTLMKAIEAGADCVDTATNSLNLVEMLEGTGYTTALNRDRLLKLQRYFELAATATITYNVKLNGHTHKVTVSPGHRSESEPPPLDAFRP